MKSYSFQREESGDIVRLFLSSCTHCLLSAVLTCSSVTISRVIVRTKSQIFQSILNNSHKYNVVLVICRSKNGFIDALLENVSVGGHRAPVIHTGTALPWDRTSMDGRMSVEKRLDCSLRSSWSHWSEILAAEF